MGNPLPIPVDHFTKHMTAELAAFLLAGRENTAVTVVVDRPPLPK